MIDFDYIHRRMADAIDKQAAISPYTKLVGFDDPMRPTPLDSGTLESWVDWRAARAVTKPVGSRGCTCRKEQCSFPRCSC